MGTLGSSDVPNDASAEGGPERSPRSDPATLLTAAAVALNQHADLLVDLGRLFAAAGHELYLVGGSVRDALMGRLGTDLDFTTDANPYKQGKYTPGTHIPILPVEAIDEAKPDYILILPWNLRKEIVAQMRHVASWGAKFVVPIPEATIIDPKE